MSAKARHVNSMHYHRNAAKIEIGLAYPRFQISGHLIDSLVMPNLRAKVVTANILQSPTIFFDRSPDGSNSIQYTEQCPNIEQELPV